MSIRACGRESSSSSNGLTARGVSEEKVCDCVGDREARRAFEPEEFAARIKLEKDVPVVRCKDDVDGAVVQREVIHERQNFFFDFMGELVGAPVLKHAKTIAAPVVSGARRDL